MKDNLILLVDDDNNISKMVKLYLTKEGFEVETAEDGEEGLSKFHQLSPALVILDIMMPKLNGIEVIKQIRKEGNTPVVMLTAKAETFDKVLGLELGADDYVSKPFEPKELVARVKAVMRRSGASNDTGESVNYDGLKINLADYTVEHNGDRVELPPKELELLYFLASHPNKVYTREQLLANVWGFDFFGDSRTVDVHIKRLREKVSEGGNWSIKTVWGVGYKFEVR